MPRESYVYLQRLAPQLSLFNLLSAALLQDLLLAAVISHTGKPQLEDVAAKAIPISASNEPDNTTTSRQDLERISLVRTRLR